MGATAESADERSSWHLGDSANAASFRPSLKRVNRSLQPDRDPAPAEHE
jgi:hypothetical protein